jgi:predicted phage tail protein
MLRTIKVYGPMATFLKRRVFKADVANPAEAVRFLIANFPALERHMADQYYKVQVSDRALELGSAPDELHLPIGQQETISIIPVMAGAGAAGRIIAGVALIALAFIPGIGTATAAAIAAGAKAGLTAVGTVLFSLGASLAIGGIAQLLTPVPKIGDAEDDPRKSYSFSGVQNVSRQGVPVPIVYGEMIVGSIVISAGISTDKVEVAA